MNNFICALIAIFSLALNLDCRADSVRLNRIISEAKVLKFEKWDLILNGDSLYQFETDQNKLLFIYISMRKDGDRYQFGNLKFGNDADYTKYVALNEIGINVNYLEKLLRNINLNQIDPKTERKHIEYLLKCFDEIERTPAPPKKD